MSSSIVPRASITSIVNVSLRARLSQAQVESGVDVSLYDVTDSAAGFFAVGGGGVVLNRTENGWIKILDGGPTGNGNDLYTCDVTDDEERLWFAGSSGAIGASISMICLQLRYANPKNAH